MFENPYTEQSGKQPQVNRQKPVDKRVVALIDYIIRTDWRKANSVLLKNGYPQPQEFNAQVLREQLIDFVGRYGKDAISQLVEIETPYSNFVEAKVKDEMGYIGTDNKNPLDYPDARKFWNGRYLLDYPTYAPHEQSLDYNIINPDRIKNDVAYRTEYEGWIGRLISGVGAKGGLPRYNYNPREYSSFMGVQKSEESDLLKTLSVVFALILLIYLLTKGAKAIS